MSPKSTQPPPLSDPEMRELAHARALLESTSLAIRLSELLGRPVEKGLEILPAAVRLSIQQLTRGALRRVMSTALATLGAQETPVSRERGHKWAAAAAGAAGGLFGLAGVAVELPLTTGIIFRSIGDIARSEGHELGDPATRIDCLSVFALGGPAASDDAGETSYYATRAALALAVNDALGHLASKGMLREGAPVLLRLIETIAARFGLVVQEKVALEAVPLLGAVGGSLINVAFIEHFQRLARGHFIVSRLERIHGADVVRSAFSGLRRGA